MGKSRRLGEVQGEAGNTGADGAGVIREGGESASEMARVRITERSKVLDHRDGTHLYVTGETVVADGEVRHVVGNDAGKVLPSGRLRSSDLSVRNWEHRKQQERRRANGYLNPVTRAVPKLPNATRKIRRGTSGNGVAPLVPPGVCPQCGGEGEYQWGDFMRRCEVCGGTGRVAAPAGQ